MKSDGNPVLSEMNAAELRHELGPQSIGVLIFGACENHGDHLPFGADSIMPYRSSSGLFVPVVFL
jgi:creatinine amidohydrolase